MQNETREREAIGRVIAINRALYLPVPMAMARWCGIKRGDRLALFAIAADEIVVKRIPMEELMSRIIYKRKPAPAEEVIA